MTVEEITPVQFETYLLLVATARPYEDLADYLGVTSGALRQQARALFDVFGVSTRLELSMQYHYREKGIQ
jgi:hypothetical protein